MAEHLDRPPQLVPAAPQPPHPDDIAPSPTVALGEGDAPPEDFRADDAVVMVLDAGPIIVESPPVLGGP